MPFTGLPDPGHRVMDLYGAGGETIKIGKIACADADRQIRYVKICALWKING